MRIGSAEVRIIGRVPMNIEQSVCRFGTAAGMRCNYFFRIKRRCYQTLQAALYAALSEMIAADRLAKGLL